MPNNTVLENTTVINRAEEVRLMRLHPNNADKIIVLVEDTDDIDFYSISINQNKVIFYPSKGCHNVVEILNHSDGRPEFNNDLIGIIDADFQHIIGPCIPMRSNLFLTDYHDWELMAMTTATAEKTSLHALGKKDPNLFEQLCEDIKCLSILKLYNAYRISINLTSGINFKKSQCSSIYDGSAPISMENCLEQIRNQCDNSSLTDYPTIKTMNEYYADNDTADLHQVSCGHDVIWALTQKIHQVGYDRSIGKNQISLLLRFGYSIDDFQRTTLYHDIDAWAKQYNYNIWNVN